MGMNEMLKALKGLPAEVKKLLDENGQLVDFAGNFICRF
jgi:hypothetical protein